MRRPWQIWLVFCGCVLVAVVSVAWLSYRALESERAELTARTQAGLEENARLALWRIDSAVASLIAQENARPSFTYRSFYPTNYPQIEIRVRKSDGALLAPSPLLSANDPRIKLYFEFDAAGEAHSPRALTAGEMRSLVPRYLSQQAVDESRQRLRRFAELVELPQLLALMPPASAQPGNSRVESRPQAIAQQQDVPAALPRQGALNALTDLEQQAEMQQARGTFESRGMFEYRARSQAVAANSILQVDPERLTAMRLPEDAEKSAMTPLWVGDQLLLVRQVGVGGQRFVQGCWLDWPLIRGELLASVSDLLPEVQLLPAQTDDMREQGHLMAALPIRLVAGDLPPIALDPLSPVRASLLLTWGSLALAVLAVALLIRGVLALSERRAAFVSAVTHELRTPLTTFRMYAEMLAENMVPDEASRQRYLQTLRTEADRLSHLVENVLAYARLERGGPGARIGPVPVAELLGRASERLAPRAAQAGFEIHIGAPPEPITAQAVADCAAVEQILFNLVDNACKYAAAAENRTLQLDVVRRSVHFQLRLRDHGPGVAVRERKRLFQPFRKSATDAAVSAPGVGLGLALCRRLAHDMGGDLSLENHAPDGACFVLTLKVFEG